MEEKFLPKAKALGIDVTMVSRKVLLKKSEFSFFGAHERFD